MVLSHSRHMFVGVVHKMDQQAWLQCYVDAFGLFDGTPAILVIDNLKAGVLKPGSLRAQDQPRLRGAGRLLRHLDRPLPGGAAQGQTSSRETFALHPRQLLRPVIASSLPMFGSNLP